MTARASRFRSLTAAMICVVLFAGCKSKQDQAIHRVKQQATATGQAQQVETTDAAGDDHEDQ